MPSPDEDGFERQPTAAERQASRIDALPAVYKTQHERLAYELALKMDEPEAIFAKHGYSEDQALALLSSPGFSLLFDKVTAEVAESGQTFRMKARAQAEALLTQSFEIATDPTAPTSERVKLIQWTAKVAGYEPKPTPDDTGQGAGGFNLTIQFAGQQPQQVVTGAHVPAMIENGS